MQVVDLTCVSEPISWPLFFGYRSKYDVSFVFGLTCHVTRPIRLKIH